MSTNQTKTVQDVDFGIFFFASSIDSLRGKGDLYNLLIESARFADGHGFSSVWVPERHFTEFGFIYPNPALVLTGLATITERIRLCAGSLVSPLHNVVRVVEEWSVLDNISRGRIGASFAPGWNPDDFVLYPERYAERRDENFRNVGLVRKLWKDQSFTARNGQGKEVELKIFPPPYSAEFPMWVTASGNPETFRSAGELGANVLTHLLDQDLAALKEKIELYRRARYEHGHDPDAGTVTAMIHSFVGADRDAIREEARAPYCQFLKQNISLAQGLAADRGHRIDVRAMSEKDIDTFLNFLYDRFVFDRAFIGDPESCVDLAGKIFASGVDELGCLLDFGPPAERVLENLPYLDRLKNLCRTLPASQYQRAQRSWERTASVGGSKELDATPPSLGRDASLDAIRRRLSEQVSGVMFYSELSDRGWVIDEEQRSIRAVWRGAGEALAHVVFGDSNACIAAPVDFLERCFPVAVAAVAPDADAQPSSTLLIPSGFKRLQSTGSPGASVWVHARLRSGPGSSERVEADLRILDDAGTELATVRGLRFEPGIAAAAADDVSDWLYWERWHPSEAAPASADPGHWLILADRGGVSERLAASLEAAGHTCSVIAEGRIEAPGGFPNASTLEQSRTIAATGAAALRSLFDRELKATQRARTVGVVCLWGLDAAGQERLTPESLMADQYMACGGLTLVIQALVATEDVKLPKLWVVTQGAKAVRDGEKPLAVSQAPLWGIGKTCAVEHPELWGGLVDLEVEIAPDVAASHLCRCLLAGDREDQVAVRGGERHVVRVVHERAPATESLSIRNDVAYLITGGLKGFGFEVARWLVRNGARHLVLLGRKALPERGEWARLGRDSVTAESVRRVQELEKLGASVHHPAVDVTNEEQVSAFFANYATSGLPPLRGVFHCAAVWTGENGQTVILPLSMTDVSSIAHVFPPKVVGSWLLSKYLRGAELDFFVTFSAAAGLLGSAGQVVYTAANAFMDTLAHDLRLRGVLPATSINWGPIKEVGSGATLEGRMMHQLAERRGLLGMEPEKAMEALALILPQRSPQVGVMQTNWELLVRSYTGMLSAPWASELVGSMPAIEHADLVLALKEAAPEDRTELLCASIQKQVVMVMGYSAAEAPEPDQGLFELGLDSLLALELKNHIQTSIRKDFPATAIFDYPTILSLAVYLLTQVLNLPVSSSAASMKQANKAELLDEIDQLSEAEVEARLARELAAGATL